jgi:hypothetical protein
MSTRNRARLDGRALPRGAARARVRDARTADRRSAPRPAPAERPTGACGEYCTDWYLPVRRPPEDLRRANREGSEA